MSAQLEKFVPTGAKWNSSFFNWNNVFHSKQSVGWRSIFLVKGFCGSVRQRRRVVPLVCSQTSSMSPASSMSHAIRLLKLTIKDQYKQKSNYRRTGNVLRVKPQCTDHSSWPENERNVFIFGRQAPLSGRSNPAKVYHQDLQTKWLFWELELKGTLKSILWIVWS